jgi:arylsulfatase
MIDRMADEPFFVFCSFPDPHHPFSACEPYASMYDRGRMPEPLSPSLAELAEMPPAYQAYHLGEKNYFSQIPPFNTEIAGAPLREMMAQTYGMVTHVDHNIGRVFDHLSARGLTDDILIIFTSDHGELLGDHGFLLKGPFYYQSLLNVPLIIHCPGVQADVRQELVAHVDLVPTVMECLGLEIPDYLPGHSLAGHLHGNPVSVRDAVLTKFRPFTGPNMKVLHTGEWKYVYYHGQDYGEMFNLQTDPEERYNLYSHPDYQEMKQKLHARLLEELVETESRWPARGAWT